MDSELIICPCCRFPTLGESGAYEICEICWWEDDGQSYGDADEARGGPNQHYSLSAARRNFADHGHMFDKGKGIEVVERPSAPRRALMDYLASIGFDASRADPKRVEELLSA